MAFWSGERLFAEGANLFDPYDPTQIDCNAYVLRMGDRYYRTADDDQAGGGLQTRLILSPNEGFVIPPGQFAFLLCKETIAVPNNAMAFISMRTPFKFRGLINVSGFHVDPGYTGKLVYAVFNASPSPVQLKENDRTFKIWFCDLGDESAPPYLSTPDQSVNDVTNEMMHGMNREILSLQSLAKKLRDQERDIERRFSEQKPVIDNLTFVWRAITLGVIGAIMISILALAAPVLWDAGKLIGKRLLASLAQELYDAPTQPHSDQTSP